MNNEEKMMNSVPMGQKIAFGLGMLANQLFPALLSIFIVVLIQDLGFSPLLYGIIAFIPRFIDAITDPLMGFISDNTTLDKEQCLLDQDFIKDDKSTVAKYVSTYGEVEVSGFKRVSLG